MHTYESKPLIQKYAKFLIYIANMGANVQNENMRGIGYCFENEPDRILAIHANKAIPQIQIKAREIEDIVNEYIYFSKAYKIKLNICQRQKCPSKNQILHECLNGKRILLTEGNNVPRKKYQRERESVQGKE